MVHDPFKALSHPIRRGIVERLAAGLATVGVATAGFEVSKPAISKHLKVLEETGVVTRVVKGRKHVLSLDIYALGEAADWMDRQRALWGRMLWDEEAAHRHEYGWNKLFDNLERMLGAARAEG